MDMMRFKALIIIIIITLVRNCDAKILSKPKDTEAVVGDSVFLACSFSAATDVQWFYYGEGEAKERSFVYGYDQIYPPFNGRFRVEKNEATATYNLIIDSVTVADAGKYECHENVGRGEKSSAQLIVLDSRPVCQSNIDTSKVIGSNGCGIEPSLLVLSCSVNFHGNEAPILQWTNGGDTSFAGTVNHAINGNSVVYNLTMNGDSIMNNSHYTCSSVKSVSAMNSCHSNKIKIIGTSTNTSSEASCAPYCLGTDCMTLWIIIISLICVSCLAFIETITIGVYCCCRYKRTKQRKEIQDRHKTVL